MSALVVGSSVIDLFLTASDSKYTTHNDAVQFTLGDKIPTQINKLTLGGNGSNVSVGLKRLGVPTTFYTYLGTDILSKEIEEVIVKEGVFLSSQKGEGDNTSLSLIFGFKSDRIIFSHHEVRNHIFSAPKNLTPQLIYLTSIGDYWQQAYKQVIEYSREKNTVLAFSPGSSQLQNINDVLIGALHNSTLLFINREEAAHILHFLNKSTGDIPTMLTELKACGPNIVSITDGAQGAYALAQDESIHHIKPFGKSEDCKEKTGAGDSYASAFLGAYMQKLPIPECMRWGAVNAWSVMRYIGAQQGLLPLDDIKKLSKAHSDFKTSVI